jgi:hypothetical protein
MSSPRPRMKIIDRLPISDKRTSLQFQNRYTTIHRSQILVWVSVHLPGALEPEENTPRFPALMDTGNNFDFSVQERHLREWAGIDPGLLVGLGDIEINGKVVTCRRATVWLYPNVPGSLEAAGGARPLKLTMPRGIAVYAQNDVSAGPRLPLLGLPALLNNDLDLWLDPEQRQISVQQRGWSRGLIRLLRRL